MRVLFVAMPLIGHLFPMMALVETLRERGHEVMVATGGDAAAVVRARLPVAEVAPPIDYRRAAVRGLGAHPVLAWQSGRGMADPRGGAHVFAVTNRPMIEPLSRAAIEFRPQVIVHEPFASAAAIVADRLGVPTILHNIAFDNGTLIRRELLPLLTDTALPAPASTLSIAPPSLAGVEGQAVRYTPYSTPGAATPAFLREPSTRRRVLVTRSTMLGDGPNPMLRAIVRAAPQVDADIVIVRPDRKTLHTNGLPANVHTTGWIALHEALPHCTGMVNHAGAGSVYAALHAGIPQIATPAPGDRAWNALSVQRRGAGLAVPARSITAAHLNTLLADPDLAAAARAVAAEIAAMPSVTDIADEITRSASTW
ncbi:UDP:flavonoid glycosyltransferase YjiC (YdhE family) [Nocardia alba]|uniref:UDP:flavonoid glycosyltransferase YjiC (YdhE family) n=2 Tax=Nocardia alba TaxID=225051 RepID=A0A4R1FZG8_9NOCA|nr:UDP:flavonoid glycosyltransferase YjiC (YdhE family) [Nocardia alba]